MKQKLRWGLTFFVIILFVSTIALAEDGSTEYDLEENISRQLEKLDLYEIESFIQEIDNEIGEYIPEISIKDLISRIKDGEISLSFSSIFNGILKFVFNEFLLHTSLLGRLIILSIVCSIIQNLQSAFNKGTVTKLAYAVAYLVLITMAIGSFTAAIEIGRNAIDQMTSFVQALIPILLTLLAAMGGFSSAAFIHPFLMVAIGVIVTIINTIVFPLIYFYAALIIVNHISDGFKVNQLASLIKDITLAVMMLCLTIFVGALGFQGVSGIVADSLSLRTAKFLTGTFVPVVGGMFTDALEAIIGTSILLKNAIGLAGVLILVVLCIFPMLKILIISLMYKLSGALVQPFGESQIGDALLSMAKCINLVFAAVAAVGLMFFIGVSIIIGLGNVLIMMR